MRQAEFRYRLSAEKDESDIKLGTIFWNDNKNNGWFSWKLIGAMIDGIRVKPETLITMLEEIRFDVAQENFDFDSYIQMELGRFYFKELI